MAMKRQAEVWPTHTPRLFRKAVRRAVELLRAGEVVALPTETVYGLAAHALDPDAVARIFQIKGRPARNPIIVHVASVAMAQSCVSHWPEIADRLAASFWPGPLTLVLKRSPVVPSIVTAGGSTVGLRWPAHPFIQEVIRECNFPLAAPSANRSTELSPTNVEHVRKSLGHCLPLIVDGGQAQVGIESTVIDLTSAPPRVLRPGIIHAESLLAVTGGLASGDVSHEPDPGAALRSPGLLRKHYAPKAKVWLWSWENDAELNERLSRLVDDRAKVHIIAHTHIPMALYEPPAKASRTNRPHPGPLPVEGRGRRAPNLPRVSIIPRDAQAFARAIYAELHRCDEAGAALIIVEKVPDDAAWQGIADRLRRAASE